MFILYIFDTYVCAKSRPMGDQWKSQVPTKPLEAHRKYRSWRGRGCLAQSHGNDHEVTWQTNQFGIGLEDAFLRGKHCISPSCCSSCVAKVPSCLTTGHMALKMNLQNRQAFTRITQSPHFVSARPKWSHNPSLRPPNEDLDHVRIMETGSHHWGWPWPRVFTGVPNPSLDLLLCKLSIATMVVDYDW